MSNRSILVARFKCDSASCCELHTKCFSSAYRVRHEAPPPSPSPSIWRAAVSHYSQWNLMSSSGNGIIASANYIRIVWGLREKCGISSDYSAEDTVQSYCQRQKIFLNSSHVKLKAFLDKSQFSLAAKGWNSQENIVQFKWTFSLFHLPRTQHIFTIIRHFLLQLFVNSTKGNRGNVLRLCKLCENVCVCVFKATKTASKNNRNVADFMHKHDEGQRGWHKGLAWVQVEDEGSTRGPVKARVARERRGGGGL